MSGDRIAHKPRHGSHLLQGKTKEAAIEEDVEKQRTGAEWPDDKPFPLTPMEAYWIMRGWCVRPKSAPDSTTFNEMPGKGLEMMDGYINLTT